MRRRDQVTATLSKITFYMNADLYVSKFKLRFFIFPHLIKMYACHLSLGYWHNRPKKIKLAKFYTN
jgi:hypothetical protein